MMKHALLGALVAVAVSTAASAQSFKMTTPFAPGVAVPAGTGQRLLVQVGGRRWNHRG